MSLAALTDSTTANASFAETLTPTVGRFGEDDVGQFGLGMIGDTNRADIAVDADPFVRLEANFKSSGTFMILACKMAF